MGENDLYKRMIRKKIFELADDKYKKFQEKLCPDNDNIVGVRLPLLRKLATEVANNIEAHILSKRKGLGLSYLKRDIIKWTAEIIAVHF